MTTPFALAGALATAALLAACGGGGSDPDPVATEVPASAALTPEAYAQYTQALVQATDDLSEALSLAMVDAPPTSETADPVDFD